MADNSYVPLGLYLNYLLAHLQFNGAMWHLVECNLFNVLPLSWCFRRQHGQEGKFFKKAFFATFCPGCVNPLQPAELSAAVGHCWLRSWCRHFHPPADILSSLCIPELYLESKGENSYTNGSFNNSSFRELLCWVGCVLLLAPNRAQRPWVGGRAPGDTGDDEPAPR